MGRSIKDITGLVFGRLTVVSWASTNKCGARWNCLCICGNTVIVNGGHLRSGTIKSCGCLQRLPFRHTLTYSSWNSMKSRCLNPKFPKYKNYGGRGIKICERWMKFDNFLEDMGERPEDKTLDRYPNNDGNYEPGNCRWATSAEQQHHRKPKNNYW